MVFAVIAFTVTLRVLVPRIERVDFSTSDTDPLPPTPESISSLLRLLRVEILSSSSSHARTACEGMCFRFIVGVVTPCDFAGVNVDSEPETAPALLALALALPFSADDPLRWRVGGIESASAALCARRFPATRCFHSVDNKRSPSSTGTIEESGNLLSNVVIISIGDGPGVGMGGGVSGPALLLPDVDGEGEVRRELGADLECAAFFFAIFSRAMERCSWERGASLISMGSNVTSTGPDADRIVTC